MSNVERALISVSDKTGIVEFAQALADKGVELLSTGGTFKKLQEAGIAVREVSDYTGFPEMMAGRVKTLHPKVHGGILGRRGQDEQVMADNDISRIDLVVVNLYPFEATVANPDCSLEDAIENIDIGGPAMLRAAAKNGAFVAVCTDGFEQTNCWIAVELCPRKDIQEARHTRHLRLRTLDDGASHHLVSCHSTQDQLLLIIPLSLS